MRPLDKTKAIELLNRVLEVRYTHYALMVFGHNRIPIIGWLKDQADESLLHARRAGELVTLLGGHPSLGIGPLLESHKHSIDDILRASLSHEREALGVYYQLLVVSEGRSVLLEEYARQMIADEELHVDAVNKMLRAAGDIAPYASS